MAVLMYIKASITSAVAEPSTYAPTLSGLSVIALIAARHRKKQRNPKLVLEP